MSIIKKIKLKSSLAKKFTLISCLNVLIIITIYTIVSTYLAISKLENDIENKLKESANISSHYLNDYIDKLISYSSFIKIDKKFKQVTRSKNDFAIIQYITEISDTMLNSLGTIFMEIIQKNNKIITTFHTPLSYKTQINDDLIIKQSETFGIYVNIVEKKESINIKIANTIYDSSEKMDGFLTLGFSIDNDNWFVSKIKKIINTDIIIFNNESIISSTLIDENLNSITNIEYNKEIVNNILNNTINQGTENLTINNIDYSISYIPLKSERTQTIGVIGILHSRENIKKIRNESIVLVIVLGLFAAFISTIFSVLLSKKITDPILKLVSLTTSISKGNYNVKLEHSAKDEIGSLINSFNKMAFTINEYKEHLEDKVNTRTEELNYAIEELNIANEKLKKLDVLKNDFIANITHDFRSPLTVILNIADIALKYNKNITTEDKENYNIIYKASLKLKKTIDQLLDLAKMDAKGVQLKVQEVQIILLLNNIIDYYKSSISNKGIKIIKKYPDTKITNFYTDPEKLEEIINNIFSNAIKFVDTDKGVIEVDLVDNENEIEITIFDNGIGIEKEQLEIIFNRFEQVESSRNSFYKGTGIGLSFAKQLITYLKGDIKAESKGLGYGSKFIITLKKGKNIFKKSDFISEKEKAYQFENYQVSFDVQENHEKSGVFTYLYDLNKNNEYDLKKCIILIIDDNKDIRQIIIQYLRHYGFLNFVCASDGIKGLQAVYDYSPDLIICDYNMPNMRGDQFHDEILSNPKFKFVPFIFLSAIASQDIIYQRKEKGASEYLKKPINQKELYFSVKLCLKKYIDYLKTTELVSIDELTKLLNKKSFRMALIKRLNERELSNFSIIFFDLDKFNQVNNQYGHQAGDYVLSTIGNILLEELRKIDICARYTTDKFIILLDKQDLPQTKLVAQKIQNAISNYNFKFDKKTFNLSISMGISSLIDNESYICENLSITNLDSLFINNENSQNWEKINKVKHKVADLLIMMAEKALIDSKYSYCNSCNYKSLNSEVFKDNSCPKCNNDDITIGRNKIFVFKEEE